MTRRRMVRFAGCVSMRESENEKTPCPEMRMAWCREEGGIPALRRGMGAVRRRRRCACWR
eukprot:179652-Rhodomonas_salina.1